MDSGALKTYSARPTLIRDFTGFPVTGTVDNAVHKHMFSIILIDEYDPRGTTVHTLTDPKLWAWIHRAETFPDDAEAVDVLIPGTGLVASVTRWDPALDKVQYLVSLPGTGGRPHPGLTRLDLGESGTRGFTEAVERLRVNTEVFEGVW